MELAVAVAVGSFMGFTPVAGVFGLGFRGLGFRA